MVFKILLFPSACTIDKSNYCSVSTTFVDTEKYFPVTITNTGSATWLTPRIIKSSCLLDVTYFPWDQQACKLKYGSWTYQDSKVETCKMSFLLLQKHTNGQAPKVISKRFSNFIIFLVYALLDCSCQLF